MVLRPRIWAFELDGRRDEDRFQLLTASSVMFDAVHVPGGEKKKVRRMNLKELWTLIKDTFAQWSEDNPFQLAAALAYYTLFPWLHF